MDFPKFADAALMIDEGYPTEQQQIEALLEIEETYQQFFSTMRDEARAIAEKISPPAQKGWSRKWDGATVALDGNDVVVTREYNDSCGCHPSYTTDECRFPKAMLTDGSAVDAHLKMLEDQKTAAAAAVEAKKKADAELAAAQAQLARKAQFDALKKEFGT